QLQKITRLPEQQVFPLLQRMEAAKSGAERQAAVQPVLALGLPALPAIRERLRTLKPDHPAYADIKELAVGLAGTVSEVRFTEESVPPPKEFKKQVEELKGKALVAARVAELIRTIMIVPSPGVTGIKFTIDRDDDESGVKLIVALTRSRIRQEGSQKGWVTY